MTARLLGRIVDGDQASWDVLLARHRPRLRMMVELRLDERLRARIDVSEIIRLAHAAASRRLAEYLRDPQLPFYLWLRSIAKRKLSALHRRHLGLPIRSATDELSLYRGALPETTAATLAAGLMDGRYQPTEAVLRAGMKIRLQQAINSLELLDRQVLVLRHFEHLTTAETARVLGIEPPEAARRHVRALRRLKRILAGTERG